MQYLKLNPFEFIAARDCFKFQNIDCLLSSICQCMKIKVPLLLLIFKLYEQAIQNFLEPLRAFPLKNLKQKKMTKS